MRNIEIFGMAVDALRLNRLRSGLTMLGIIIGVLTVIVMSSVINGINRKVGDMIAELGTNTLYVVRLATFGARPTMEQLSRKELTADDMNALQHLSHVVAASAALRYVNYGEFGGVGSMTVKGGRHKAANVGLGGENYTSVVVNEWNLDEGRFFTAQEQDRSAKVVILGSDTAAQLFPHGSALGQDVDMDGVIGTVIGTLLPVKGLTSGKSPDDSYCYVPLTTFHHMHPEVKDYWITVKYDEEANRVLVEEEIREVLRVRRRVLVDKDDNFSIFGTDVLTHLWKDITNGLFFLMFAISGVSLLVGGIGVMNIMLVVVTERTREIGVRKALGASARIILLQFAIEATTMCGIGGIIGVLGGMLIVGLLHFILPCVLSGLWVAAAFSTSCAIGLLFGIYPAWVASKLQPIDSLRYE